MYNLDLLSFPSPTASSSVRRFSQLGRKGTQKFIHPKLGGSEGVLIELHIAF